MNRGWLMVLTAALVPILMGASGCGPKSFTVAVSSLSANVAQAGTATVTVSVAGTNGFASPVALTATGLPSGVTASFNPSLAPINSSSTLTLTASASAATGTSQITITGQAEGQTVTGPLDVTIKGGATQPPTITKFTATPSSLTAAGNVTLEWEVTGATSLEIDQGVGAVTPLTAGSKSVTVSATKSFTLTAKSGSATSTKSVDVSVGSGSNLPGVWDSTNWNEAVWQ